MPTPTPIPTDFAACPHERGPGIAVCLRCRADSHRKAAELRRTLATRLGVGIVVAFVAVMLGTSAMGTRMQSSGPAGATHADSARTESFAVTQAGAAEPGKSGAATRAAPAAAAAPAVHVTAGRTDLSDGIFAFRSGDSISVHFDTPVYRTRRRDKFEHVVRTTLPEIYGALADSALAAVPDGQLATAGDLLTELPARGIALPARDGWALTLWPSTRPGQDGPLVVSYRVTLARAQ